MKVKDMVRCAVCAALLTVCAWIAVPVGTIGFTMQSFGVFMILCLLGGAKGTVSYFIYLLLGAVGFPVFSGFQGGLGVLIGPTGGYLMGFALACLLFWLLEKVLPHWLLMILGMVLCYVCGSVWFYILYAGSGFIPIMIQCVLPYLLPDGIKLALAWLTAHKISSVA